MDRPIISCQIFRPVIVVLYLLSCNHLLKCQLFDCLQPTTLWINPGQYLDSIAATGPAKFKWK